MASRSAIELFRLRLAQLRRDPFFWLLAAFNLALVGFTTILGPLPPSDGGFAWRELSLAGQSMVAWCFALFLSLSPAGRLLHHLPALPLDRDRALHWWTAAETLAALVLLLPGVVLLLLVLPGGPRPGDLGLAALTLGQAALLATGGGAVRDLDSRRGAVIPAMILLWLLLFLPPLSLADPRRVLGMEDWNGWTLLGGLLLWAGLWLATTALRGLAAGAGQPSGSPDSR